MAQSPNSPQSVFSRQDIDSPLVVGSGGRAPIAVLILGAEPSGAALCAKMLDLLGVRSVAERSSDNSDNANHPGSSIAQLHELVLTLFNRTTNSPYADLLLPAAWWNDSRVHSVKQQIAKILELQMASGGTFAISDPEITRMLPIWLPLVEELHLEPRLVLCLRNPADLSRCLQQDGVDPELTEYRWFSHMIELFRNLRHRNLCVIEHEDWFTGPEENFKKLIGHLGLPETDRRLPVAELLASQRTPVVESSCRHPLVPSLYKLVRSLSEDPTAGERIGQIVDNFVTYQQLQRPLLREFARIGEAAAALPQIEREVSRYSGLIVELRTELDGLTVELEASRSAAGAQPEVDRQRTPETEQEERELELHAEISARNAALSKARERVAALSAERDAALAERSVAQSAIERFRRDAAPAKQAAEAATQQLNKAPAEPPADDGAPGRSQQESALQKAAAERARHQLEAMRAREGIGRPLQPGGPSPPQRAP